MVKTNLYDFTRPELTALFNSHGFSEYYADLIWAGLYRKLVDHIEKIEGISSQFLEKMEGILTISLPNPLSEQQSSDNNTRKFLLALNDDRAIETVIMRHNGRRERPEDTRRYTACISTQVGCAMGCVFCATGQMGFFRHLTAGEIVSQVTFVQRFLAQTGEQLRNLVFMGMGEPLHNYDSTIKAIEIITDHRGLALASRHITVSTVGLPAAIRRLADEGHLFNLAVSLHGATDEERAALVPPARRWPLSELLDACIYYTKSRRRRIFFEWALIDHENDSPEQAHRLGQLLQGMNAHVNVIPLNPTSGFAGQPSAPDRVKRFQEILADYGLPSTVRQRRGIDIGAGCGQLAVQNNTALNPK